MPVQAAGFLVPKRQGSPMLLVQLWVGGGTTVVFNANDLRLFAIKIRFAQRAVQDQTGRLIKIGPSTDKGHADSFFP
jgi:hypothetical protein